MDILAYKVNEKTIPVLIHISGRLEDILRANMGYIAYRNERMRWMLTSERAFKSNHPNVEIKEEP